MSSEDQEPIIPKEEKHSDNETLCINADTNNSVQHYGTLPQKQKSNPDTTEEDSEPPPTWCTRVLQILSSLTIEPALFCYMLGFILNMSCLTNMIMDKGCLHELNISSDICSNLSHYPKEKDDVEKLGSDYGLYNSLLTPLGVAILVFIAPWSDKYGRKPPFVMAMFGAILTDIGFLICAVHFESRLVYLIVANVPMQLFGGFMCVVTMVFSHATEVTSSKKRTLKYTTVELAFGLSMCLGSLIGGLLYRYYSYVHVYATSLALHVVAIPWVVLVVPETSGLGCKASWGKKLLDFFSFSSVKDGLRVFCKVRENYGRAQLWSLFATSCCMLLTYEAFASIGFLYAHHQFNWDSGTYNQVNTIIMVAQMGALILVVPPLLKYLKVGDPMLGIIGVISTALKNIIISLSKNEEYLWVFYLGNATAFLSPTASLACRSRISKLVHLDELARIFVFLAVCEALVPMFGTILLTRIFNATMDIFPSISYLTATALLVIPFVTFVMQHRLTKNKQCEVNQSINKTEEKA